MLGADLAPAGRCGRRRLSDLACTKVAVLGLDCGVPAAMTQIATRCRVLAKTTYSSDFNRIVNRLRSPGRV